jgi:hypothetical protein
VYRLHLYSVLITIQLTFRPSPHMQPPVHRTHTFTNTHQPRYLHGATVTVVTITPADSSNTNIWIGSNTPTRKSQTAVRVTGLSITEGTKNRTCFKSPQSGAFECRGGTKIFGKSVNPCPSRSSPTTEHIFITTECSGFCANKAFLKNLTLE